MTPLEKAKAELCELIMEAALSQRYKVVTIDAAIKRLIDAAKREYADQHYPQ